jgi:hypothetical protein
VTFDGQFGHPLQADDVVEIRRAEQPLRLVRASTAPTSTSEREIEVGQ